EHIGSRTRENWIWLDNVWLVNKDRFFSKVQNVSSNIQYDSTRSSFVQVTDSSQLKGSSDQSTLLFLRARSACASRAIGALLSSYSSLDSSDGLRRSFPTKIERAVSHRDVDSFSAPMDGKPLVMYSLTYFRSAYNIFDTLLYKIDI
uniref:Ycf2 N-terminal domain-containing protein n=1 Tax=Solanum lycopersicum TaxID=4081 RepID=A0A3Q7H6U4_SOLLC